MKQSSKFLMSGLFFIFCVFLVTACWDEQISEVEKDPDIVIPDYKYHMYQYFFIDLVFRNGGLVFSDDSTEFVTVPSFYPLVDGKHLVNATGVIISEIELFKSTNTMVGPGIYFGLAYIDPKNPALYPDIVEGSYFQRLVRDQDYTANENLGYIRLKNPEKNNILAISYKLTLRDKPEIFRSVGQLSSELEEGDTLQLKMLKPFTLSPSHPAWPLTFKNVYYLGSQNINPSEFDLKIIYTGGESEEKERDQQGNTFIHLFGLDDFDENGNATPDNNVDLMNTNLFNLVNGELLFPMLHPFEMDSLAGTEMYYGEGNTRTELVSILPHWSALYRSINYVDIRGQTRFDIYVYYDEDSLEAN